MCEDNLGIKLKVNPVQGESVERGELAPAIVLQQQAMYSQLPLQFAQAAWSWCRPRTGECASRRTARPRCSQLPEQSCMDSVAAIPWQRNLEPHLASELRKPCMLAELLPAFYGEAKVHQDK